MIAVSAIRLPLEADEQQAVEQACEPLRRRGIGVLEAFVIHRGIDARRRPVKLEYTVAIRVTDKEKALHAIPSAVALPTPYAPPSHGGESLKKPPVIVGSGPAGLFAALCLAEAGLCPVVLERGEAVEERTRRVRTYWEKGELDEESNVQFGEGGAGTFSDGKLNTGIHDPRCAYILQTFVRFGAPAEIMCLAKPHVGTDRLTRVVSSMRKHIESLGGKFLFRCKAEDLCIENGRLEGVKTSFGEIPTSVLVVACGHSARDTFQMLARQGVAMAPKPFSVGFRAEHLQSMIDRAMYGPAAGHPKLGAAPYKFSAHFGQDGVYTFCMCPGGTVVAASSERGHIVTNGMSNYDRAGRNANAAVLTAVTPAELDGDLFAGVRFQQQLEKRAYAMTAGAAPVQLLGDFRLGRVSHAFGAVQASYTAKWAFADLNELYPKRICDLLGKGMESFAKRLHGYDRADTVLTGPETRTTSPLRMLRGEDLESLTLRGLYPCGEGAGYAGGIMSAAADGLRVAEAILNRY